VIGSEAMDVGKKTDDAYVLHDMPPSIPTLLRMYVRTFNTS
jgi:hypothetical protein